MALVVVRVAARAPRAKRQGQLRPFERLNRKASTDGV
jgi:hypothetical protein